MAMARWIFGLLPFAAAVACSHPLKKPAPDGGGGQGGVDAMGSGGVHSGVRSGQGGDGGTPTGQGGAGGCWWTRPSGLGGMQPGERDDWPASPTRAPGPATARDRVDAWTVMAVPGSPSGPRRGATAVWTGKEMIVWGGYDGQPEATGARYDPVTDTWLPVSTSVAPRPRSNHVAVWTGTANACGRLRTRLTPPGRTSPRQRGGRT